MLYVEDQADGRYARHGYHKNRKPGWKRASLYADAGDPGDGDRRACVFDADRRYEPGHLFLDESALRPWRRGCACTRELSSDGRGARNG